jgi:hypothetical protein
MQVAIVPLHALKLGSSDLAKDPAIIHESNKYFIAYAVYFRPRRDPDLVLIAFSMQCMAILDVDSDQIALPMRVI